MNEKYKGLKIVLFRSFGSVLPSIISCMDRVLKELGAEVLVLPDLVDNKPTYSPKTFDDILKFDPDYAFALGHNGFIRDNDEMPAHEHFLNLYKIPYSIFFFDFPMNLPRLLYYKHDYLSGVFIWDREYVDIFKHFGLNKTHYLPLGTDQDFFTSPTSFRDTDDLGFIGSIIDNEIIIKHKRKLPEKLHALADSLVKKKMDDNNFNLYSIDLLSNPEVQKLSYDFFGYINTRHLSYIRKNYLYFLSRNYKISIYGNSSWIQVANDRMTVNPIIDYRTELLNVFNRTKINLNLSAAQLATSVNQRVFDCFGSGNFLLTDYRKDLDHLFSTPVPYFKSKKELVEKTKYYLTHDKERDDIASKLREEIISRHTWKHRMEEALEKTTSR